jgi:predicted dienelactone hydrolase
MKLLALVLAFALFGLAAHAGSVGFQRLDIPNGDDAPIKIAVWYPTDAATAPTQLGPFTQDVAPNAPIAGRRLPLVVISHGSGGSLSSHYDTALALAHAGFVVAALSHTGDTFDDQSRAIRIWGRPAQLERLIDYMLAEWPERDRIDRNRIGAFGFSAGGFAVLAAAGGVPDLSLVWPHCQAHPDYFDCQILKRAPAGFAIPSDLIWSRDARIKAAVVAAPALGYTFGRKGLENVTIPVQLWRDELDHILPNPYYAEAVRQTLPRAPEYHLVAGADHYDFLAPCSEVLVKSAPQICQEHAGFDRRAFHAQFNADVVAFFARTLRRSS